MNNLRALAGTPENDFVLRPINPPTFERRLRGKKKSSLDAEPQVVIPQIEVGSGLR